MSSKVATATQAKLPQSRPFLPRRRHNNPSPGQKPRKFARESTGTLGPSAGRMLGHTPPEPAPILGSISRTGRPRNLQRVPQTQEDDGPWPGSTHTCTHSRTHTQFSPTALLISSPAADKLPRQRPTTHRDNLAPTVGLTRPGCLAGRLQRLNVRPALPCLCGRAGAEAPIFSSFLPSRILFPNSGQYSLHPSPSEPTRWVLFCGLDRTRCRLALQSFHLF